MPTLLLPGTLCDAALWADVALPPGAHVWAPVRGHTLAEAAWQAASAQSGPLHVVGFSLGAIVAFELLRRWPERVQRLTLISANPLAPTAKQLVAWADQEAAVSAGPDGFEAVAQQVAAGWARIPSGSWRWRGGSVQRFSWSNSRCCAPGPTAVQCSRPTVAP